MITFAQNTDSKSLNRLLSDFGPDINTLHISGGTPDGNSPDRRLVSYTSSRGKPHLNSTSMFFEGGDVSEAQTEARRSSE